MVERKFIIDNPTGLHARPASMLVKEANKYKSDITITKNEKIANAKSILNVLALGVAKGDEIIIKAIGDDEDDAINSIVNLISTFTE
ncbi:Phosphocarrier protein HPr [Caloramator mitchellensis]|uniref:Phosphocarrier protein HPr n=1 Tax=Caloramator mitchellensis TaxID=908809 RepID=A0A0R3JT32_CALMK|nr:HPr family phosphocarrier protein [Caloramator mitchellensis]KRQ86154.1 Phosphocarrier protein HPr [Caloramator mitchellensis]